MIACPPARTIMLLACVGLAACSDKQSENSLLAIEGSEPERGRELVQAYGCGTCHMIEGVRGARGRVGTRLVNYAQQHLLAGILPNTPHNLIAWLMDPVALNPRTGMPSQGVTEAEARDIAAYLYTLGDEGRRVYPPDPPLPLPGQGEITTNLPDPSVSQSGTTARTRRIVPHPDPSGDPKS